MSVYVYVYVYVCVCIYGCLICGVGIHILRLSNLGRCVVCARGRVRVRLYMYICICVCINIYMFDLWCGDTSTSLIKSRAVRCVCVCLRVRMFLCTHFICVCVYLGV